jgi:phosphoribosylanthranilate isomerase
MFQIKICGITTVDDARLTVAAGADAVGLNFYPKSPRFVDLEQAKAIAGVLPRETVKVGLFVNAPAEQILRAFDAVPLDLIQLHGDESPELLAQLAGRPVMRAFRVTEAGLGPVAAYLEACRQLGCTPQLVLLDAYHAGQYGGTGTPTDWGIAATYAADGTTPPLVLAGGLTSDTVSEAIHAVHPAAVDTASGVESQPGRKDAARLTAFVRAARSAFGTI